MIGNISPDLGKWPNGKVFCRYNLTVIFGHWVQILTDILARKGINIPGVGELKRGQGRISFGGR